MEKSQKVANKYVCESCDYKCCNKFDYNKHLSTIKHHNATNKSQKILNKYVCESCDYICSNKFDYDMHVSTAKHQNATISREKSQEEFKCDKCETTYKHYSSLWKHSKTCNASSVTHQLHKGNSSFPLNPIRVLVFNVTCTKQIMDSMGFKGNDEFPLENNDKINKAIQSITIKSIRTLLVWKAESPEYQDSDSDFSNHCIKMHMSSVAGADRDSYYPKVVKLVAKHVKLAD